MPGACTLCATYEGEIEFELLQPFKYFKFPFDKHSIVMEFDIADTWIFTCKDRDALTIMGITEDNAQDLLLPGTGTWLLDGSLDEAVTLRHPKDALGKDMRSTCILEIKIARNYFVYFMKQILTMVLVTAGGLLALLMQPDELLGDR